MTNIYRYDQRETTSMLWSYDEELTLTIRRYLDMQISVTVWCVDRGTGL